MLTVRQAHLRKSENCGKGEKCDSVVEAALDFLKMTKPGQKRD